MDKQIIFAMTGEIKTGDKNSILKSGPIGSCIVITAYNHHNQIAVMSHIMLPGVAPAKENTKKTRYAVNAITELITLYKLDRSSEEIIAVCIAGGANVLQKTDDCIGQNVIDSIEEILKNKEIKVVARSLGGTQRRSVSFDVETGNVHCSIGDGAEEFFWNFSGWAVSGKIGVEDEKYC